MPNSQSVVIPTAGLDRTFDRADIEFHEVMHAGPSFEARVFLDNPGAGEDTERIAESGYAGAFHIFGHGGCLGDPGHCEVTERAPFDPRPAHPLTPAVKVVTATDEIRAALARDGEEILVTVVPVIVSTTPKAGRPDDALQFGWAQIITYHG